MLHSIDDALAYIDRSIVGQMTVSNALRDCRTRPTFINMYVVWRRAKPKPKCVTFCRKARDTAVMCRNALQTVTPSRMYSSVSGLLSHPDTFGRYFLAFALGFELLVLSLVCSWYRDVPLLALLATFVGVNVLTSAMFGLSFSVYRKKSASAHIRPGMFFFFYSPPIPLCVYRPYQRGNIFALVI